MKTRRRHNYVSRSGRVRIARIAHAFPRSLAEIRADAARATSIGELEGLIRELWYRYQPAVAAELLGQKWPILTGRTRAARTLGWTLRRIAKGKGDPENANNALRAVFMNAAERLEYSRLMHDKGVRFLLYRYSDYARFTGWFLSRNEAREQWSHRKPPLVVDWTVAHQVRILAVKQIGGRFEIVLDPVSTPTIHREVLS